MWHCTVQSASLSRSHCLMCSSPLIGFTLIWLLGSAFWFSAWAAWDFFFLCVGLVERIQVACWGCVLFLAWLVGHYPASAYPEDFSQGPIDEEVLFVLAFQFSRSCLLSLFTYLWPPHRLSQALFCIRLRCFVEFGCLCHWLWQQSCVGSSCVGLLQYKAC